MGYSEITLINPPALLERPPVEQSGTLFVPERLRIAAMNPGVLSLATYLNSKDYRVDILDVSLDTDYSIIEQKVKQLDTNAVGISSTSGFDYLEALQIAEYAKKHLGVPVIFGGQHAGPLGEQVLRDSPHVDAVVKYEGERPLELLLEQIRNGTLNWHIPGVAYRADSGPVTASGRLPAVKLDDLPFLDYTLYPEWGKFTPFVEESRGCVYKCDFCTSNTVNNSSIDIKSPRRFLEEMRHCVDFFGRQRSYAVLASTYGVNPQYGKEIAQGMKQFGVKWNSEFRADSHWEVYIYDLLESGYEVANIGLESASPTILRLMNKTKNPEAYLAKMKQLSSIVRDSDCVMRANFMFYVGESPITVRENIQFLMETPQIHSIQFSPLLVFPGTPIHTKFQDYRKQFGCDFVEGDYWERRHLRPVHPSRYFSFDEVAALGATLEKIFSEETAWLEAAKSLYTQETPQISLQVKEKLRDARFRRSK